MRLKASDAVALDVTQVCPRGAEVARKNNRAVFTTRPERPHDDNARATEINFDLPWNPMAIEQRIGRIDRIGQSREVFVFNLVARGTLEDELLTLLDEKIAMFELVVGEVGAWEDGSPGLRPAKTTMS